MTGQTKIVVGAVVVAGAVATGWAGGKLSRRPERNPAPAEVSSAPAPQARRIGEAFAAVAEKVAPSVVRVTVRQRPPSPRDMSGPRHPFQGGPFRRFFDRFGGSMPEPQGPRLGTGCGVIIDDQGHVLTNEHVVSDADDVTVTFASGDERKGKIVGTDPKTDLAVIKVDGGKAVPVEFGRADQMRVGEWVIAIGNPFGLDRSVTVGVLSAKDRHGFAEGQLEDFLQTDASINPGNSGGPLVNLRGQVVGINTMIAGVGTGVGFAVSESLARPIANQLIRHGAVTRPQIGIVLQTLTPELSEAMGKDAPDKGAIVSAVQKGSPAAKAGIRVGDVVVAVAGKPTEDSRDVQTAVFAQKIGEKVDMGIWRGGNRMVVGVRPETSTTERVARRDEGDRDEGLGLGLLTLTPDLGQKLGLGHGAQGAIVTAILPGGAAARAGLEPGDLIVAIDGATVRTAGDAARHLSKQRPGGHLVRVRRDEGGLFVALPNPTG